MNLKWVCTGRCSATYGLYDLAGPHHDGGACLHGWFFNGLLEKILERVYAESCRFYLVFLDKHYRDKVWTKYEKDVMTRPGRKDHIIPVIVDDAGADGAVGIPKTVGRIDLRDIWTEVQKTGAINQDVVNAIRNRCVLPLLEKLEYTGHVV